jgi:hypothetical protein
MRFLPAGDGRYRPDAPAGDAPDVTVQFDGEQLSIVGARGTAVARLKD